MTIPVTVLVLAKNEESGLGDTLDRLHAFDEVVVIDSGSTDRTVEVAEAHGAKVVQFTWDGRYPKKKQWALDHAGGSHDWVLLLDADEYPSPELIEEIAALPTIARRTRVAAYDLTLRYKFAGRFLTHGHRVVKRSLLDRSRVRFPEVEDLEAPGIREVEGHYQPQTKARIRTLRGELCHDDVDPVRSWFDRHNRYSDWEAYLAQHRAAKRGIASMRTAKGALFDRLPGKPVLFFVYAYVVRRGFLDGRPGFDYAFALTTYYWQIGVKSRELDRLRTTTVELR